MYRNFLKRGFDLVLVLIAFPLWILLLIVIGPMIYLENKGTVFYKAPRLGKNGKIFIMYKFRSMKMDAPDLRNVDKSTYISENDPRLTKIGRFIRKTSLDETPQILNILKNEMSIIGPRPDLPEHINCYEGDEIRKLEVLPGITGYNQAYYRNMVIWKERLKNDVYYVEHLSLLLDLKVFFKTIECILLRKGIYSTSKPGNTEMRSPRFSNEKLSDQKFECYSLDWDTKYFNINSAKVNLTGVVDEKDQKQILNFCKRFEFITISNLGNIKENNQWLGVKTNAFLSDMNIQFLKTLDKKTEFLDEATQVHESYPRNEKVIKIAQTAFSYSRFFRDPKLPKLQAENIYLHWTECAFAEKGKFFVIAKRKDEIAGFILFSIEEEGNIATIELIAVDKNFRGQRVGKSLISSMESFVYRNGVNKINVGTQVDNIPAIQFYTTVGFKYVSCGAVYHLWN